MAWISVHEQLKDHHKTREFARLLGCSRHEAIGILVTLWLWGVNNADRNGGLGDATAEDIAFGAMYRSDSKLLANHLVTSGWLDEIDGHYMLHDWDIWQEQWFKALDRREQSRRLMQDLRSRRKDGNVSKRLVQPLTKKKHNVSTSPSPIRNIYNDSPNGESIPPIEPPIVKNPNTAKIPTEYTMLIEAHTDNHALRREIIEWFLMRKAKGRAKAVNTPHTLQLTLDKAKKIYKNETEQIQGFKEATAGGYQAVYPLKELPATDKGENHLPDMGEVNYEDQP